jgi:dTDP-4-amino-4,6-dideoxygalactose transaminase
MTVSLARPRRADFLPFSRPTIEDEEIAEVVDSLRSGWLTTGPKVQRFEAAFREYLGGREAIAVNSATAGLHLALLALDLQPGEEVITTPLTFAATANVIVLAGGRPVFADIHRDTLQIDVDQVAARITPRTRAVIPVHFAGQPCDLDPLYALAAQHRLAVIEDAAHALGTEYRGVRIGQQGFLAVFSFHPTKNITTGEGGMIVTADEALAERLRVLRFHGISKDAWKRYAAQGIPQYDVLAPGLKYNMLDLQAALGLRQLPKLERFIAARARLAALYDAALADLPGLIRPTPVPYPARHSWHLYTPLLDVDAVGICRDDFLLALKEENIGTGLHYVAVHLHPYYRDAWGFRRGDFPQAEYVSDRIFSLPLFPQMTEEDVADVVAALGRVLARG